MMNVEKNKMNELNKFLLQIEKLVELGTEWSIIEEQYEKLVAVFNDYRWEILVHEIDMLYSKQLYKQALFKLIIEYTQNGQNPKVFDLILELFWKPVSTERISLYEQNCQNLLDYELAYGNLNEAPEFFVLWKDEVTIIYTDRKGKIGGIDFEKIKEMPEKNRIVALTNELWECNIQKLEEHSRLQKPLMDSEIPFILIYDELEWNLMLQTMNIDEWILLDRVVFIHEKEGVESYLNDKQNQYPQIYINDNKYESVFYNCFEQLIKQDVENQTKIKEYYENNAEKIKENIKNHRTKILFYTCRFSTALQYHIRDCNEAAQRLGYETYVLIETHRTRGIPYCLIRQILSEFKPDILFLMDHFRFENENLFPKEIVVICWAQDLMPHVMSKGTPGKLLERDFVISMMCDWKPFKEIGYTGKQLISQPLPANDKIYYPKTISKDELQKYGADVCMICHGGNLDASIQEAIGGYEGILYDILYDAYNSYANYAKETENIFLEEEVIRGFFDEFAKKFYQIILNDNLLDYIVKNVLTRFNPTLYRQMLAEWIIAEKDINLKLWGNGWTQVEKYKPYAMGAAPNGEIMSKILQSTKIVIGNNIALTGAARTAESLLSGTFYLSNKSVPKHDLCNIFQWIKEGEELETYSNRQELIRKIRYYLQNEEEREKKAEIGRRAAMEHLTYDSFISNVISEVGKRLDE